MNKWNSEEEMLDAIKQQLDESEQSLDQDTLRKLRQSRYAALEQLQKPKRYWVPATAAMAMTAMVTVIGLQVMTPDSVVPQSPFMEDVNLLSASDELELYEELEFYQWLELEERTS